MQALILTGGLGTRLRPLTLHTPKPLLPISNAPYLRYPIAALRRAEVRDIILCSSNDPAPYAELVRQEKKAGTRVFCSKEKDKLGTGGAIKNAEAFLKSAPFFAMNGDLLTDLDFSKMLKFHRSKKSALTLALIPVADPSQYGLVKTDSNSRVEAFIEKPSASEDQHKGKALINGGMYLMEREVLDLIPENSACSLERDIFPEMIRRGRPVYGFIAEASTYWLDIGTPEKYHKANLDMALENLKPALQAAFRKPIAAGNRVPKSARVGPGSVVGPRCAVGEGAVLNNCVLLEGARVGPGESLQNCIIGRDYRIDL